MPVKIGEIYGRLTTLELVRKRRANGQSAKYFICQCTCGKITKPIVDYSLVRGDTTSCGCYHLEYNRTHRRLVKWQEAHNYPRARGKKNVDRRTTNDGTRDSSS